MTKVDKMTADQVTEQIRTRYKDTLRYGFMEQVPNGTGFRQSSWIDAAVIHFWPSDGARRVAFEVKVTRADFLKEINNPGKNAWCEKDFHQCYYVTGPNVVKQESEIPEGWGWYLATKGGLRQKLAAKTRTVEPLNDIKIAALLRSAIKSKDVFDRHAKRQLLEEDPEYHNAKKWCNAAQRFLANSNSSKLYVLDEDQAYEELCNMVGDEDSKQAMKDVQDYLSTFQYHLAQLSDVFVVLATVGLLEKDDLSKRIIQRFGNDHVALARSRIKRQGQEDLEKQLKFLVDRGKELLNGER